MFGSAVTSMMVTGRHAPVVWCVLLLTGWACSSVDLESARGELMEADRVFARETAERRAEGWVAAFADEGVMFRPGGTVVGTDSIREIVTAWFADDTFSLTWDPVEAFVASSGDMGYTIGRYRSTRRDSAGAEEMGTGSYVTIWEKQPDGTWKVALDIGNPDE